MAKYGQTHKQMENSCRQSTACTWQVVACNETSINGNTSLYISNNASPDVKSLTNYVQQMVK